MTGLDPAIHVLVSKWLQVFVDARNKSWHGDDDAAPAMTT
jgi:hypothetical protein